MNDMSLLNELEIKIRELVSSLEREREKNKRSDSAVKESQKLSQIEDRIKNVISLLGQLESN
tara:strand:+ start:17 stop:202 length:186 start_codon:yes stop_codon:yes gene_type:complete